MTTDELLRELERAWQLLMVFGEDSLARSVAEAKQRLMRIDAQRRGDPTVITMTASDSFGTRDGTG